MSKKMMLIAIAVVVIIALVGGGLYLAHVKRQEAEEAKKVAEKPAEKEPEPEKENTETPSQEDKKSLSEQIKEEIKEQIENGEITEITPEELQEKTGIDLEKIDKEVDEIKKVLEEFNRLDNTYDYRTVTMEYLLDRAKYLGGEYKKKYEDYMPTFFERIKKEKLAKEFDSIEIQYLMFTEEDFKTRAKDYNNLTYAYVEFSVKAKHISPQEKISNTLALTKLQKIDGQWKIVGEGIIKELE